MKRSLKTVTLMMSIAMMTPAVAGAQDEVEASVGADLVSGYIWRGQDLGGASIQPAASISYKGFSLGAWGSANLNDADNSTKELDFTLSYSTGGFTVGITDYWFGGTDYFHYGAHSTTHIFEANVGYDFGAAAVNWFTNFAGSDYKIDGDRAYSSYIEVSAPFKLGGLDWTASIGAVPFESAFDSSTGMGVYGCVDGFSVVDVSVGASKDIKITDSFTVPAFAKVTMNPRSEGAYFVFGLSF